MTSAATRRVTFTCTMAIKDGSCMQLRKIGAVLVGLLDRSGKLPEVLADIVAAFLGLPRGARKKTPE